MSEPIDKSNSGPHVFKWVCLLVAVVALAVFGWMLNDVRLEVKSVAPKVEKLADKTEQLVEKADKTLPSLLTQTEQLVEKTDKTLPSILTQTEQASKTVNAHLPTLVERSETLLNRSEDAVENLARLTEGLERYAELMGIVHSASQDKGMLAYGASMLDFLGKQNAHVGVMPAGPTKELKKPVPAAQWAGFARKDVNFLSLIAKTKEDMLHGLARTRSALPLYVQQGEKAAPVLLSDWLMQNHPESKGNK